MNLDQSDQLAHAIEQLSEAAHKAGQSMDADDAYERHLDRSYALGAVHGIMRTI